MDTFPLENWYPLPEGSSQYPLEFIESRGAIKLREDEDSVDVGITAKADSSTQNIIRNFHKKRVAFFAVNPVELSGYLGKKLADAESPAADIPASGGEERVLLDKLANDAPIVNLVNSICIEGIRSGASDIHIEAGRECSRVRYRLDGVLRTIRTIENGRFPAISSRIKIMANLNILERRQPQDGRITVSVGDENVDFRVSIVPVAGGESIVLRILGRNTASGSLEGLGFAPEQLALLRKLLHIPHGLILLTGPTGSGKTTTLNAMLGEIVSDTLKVIAIEDPVEFLVDGVNQIQINEQINLGFDVLLRRVLRQDPNVIMIGEIRDSPTAEIAVRAALTGHLVLSTLHTNDAVSVIPRLVNMGVEPYLIASVLRGAAAQRLVRTICPHCREAVPADERQRRILRAAGVDSGTLWRGVGCGSCENTGYSGRTVIAELFGSDPGLEDIIMRRQGLAENSASGIATYLRASGMRSLAEEAVRRAVEGVTTFEEVEREIILSEGTGLPQGAL